MSENKPKVSTEDLTPHNSVVAVITSGNKFLLQKHLKHQMMTFQIGKVKHDQTIEEGIEMEAGEELGIRIRKAEKLFIFDKIYDFGTGPKVPIRTHVFRIDKYDGKIKNMEPNKCGGLVWWTEDQILNYKGKVSDAVCEYMWRYANRYRQLVKKSTEDSGYDPPLSLGEIKKRYPTVTYLKLKEDPVHEWRAATGIELTHREPDLDEQKRTWKNWQLMDKELKDVSDRKSMDMFNLTNRQHYEQIMKIYYPKEKV